MYTIAQAEHSPPHAIDAEPGPRQPQTQGRRPAPRNTILNIVAVVATPAGSQVLTPQ
jgi:hypothetical protein